MKPQKPAMQVLVGSLLPGAGGQHSDAISFDTVADELPLIRQGCIMRALTFVDQEIFDMPDLATFAAGKAKNRAAAAEAPRFAPRVALDENAKPGRAPCQHRSICARVSFSAVMSSAMMMRCATWPLASRRALERGPRREVSRAARETPRR